MLIRINLIDLKPEESEINMLGSNLLEKGIKEE